MVAYTPIMSPLYHTLLAIRGITINYLFPKVKASLDRLIFCFESIRTCKCRLLYLCIALRQNVNNCVPSSRVRQKNRTSGYLIPLVGNSPHVRVFLCIEVQNIIAVQLYTIQSKKVTKNFPVPKLTSNAFPLELSATSRGKSQNSALKCFSQVRLV
jgi:hypothetical protein